MESPPPLNEFIPGTSPDISLFSTVTVYGKRKSGKSVWVKWFLQAYKEYIPWFWVFTLTQLNSFYESFIPEKFIIPEFDADALLRIMERQTVARKAAELTLGKVNPRACVIWDDYNGSDIKYNSTLARYYYTGRHYMTLNIFAAQHITLTPPPIRSNTDLVILFNTDYADSLEHYWRDFAGKMHKEMFYKLFNEATSDPHSFLAINNDPNVEWDKKFYVGKAEVLDEGPEWIVGCWEMWKENEKQLKEIFQGVYIERQIIAAELAERKPANKIKCKDPLNPTIL